MKIIKGIAVFVFFGVFLSACFNPPEFSVTPSIEFEGKQFVRGKSASDADTLIISLNFKDGDGDLGLEGTQIDSPFHANYFYLADNGVKTRIITFPADIADESGVQSISILDIPAGATGKLVNASTRKQTGDTSFPVYQDPFTCTAYVRDSVYVLERDLGYLDMSKLIRTINTQPKIYVFRDTLYYETNPLHYNIDVEFLVKQADNSFQVYDIKKELCNNGLSGDGFFGRFPVLSDSENPLEGVLTYKMNSAGFRFIFGSKRLKLRIRIRDRALHESNTITTDEFGLND